MAPAGRDVRPTTDRVREALFAALGSLGAVEGARVLDLFAGSGALGIEALSRGAAAATFVDRSPAALDAVRTNLAHTRLADRAQVVRADAAAHLERLARGSSATGASARGAGAPGGRAPGGSGADRGPVAPDLVLCDPPYAAADWEHLLPALATATPGAWVVLEWDRPVPVPDLWEVVREKRYGTVWVAIARAPEVGVAPAGGASDGGDDGPSA